jgi:hypothetical protein
MTVFTQIRKNALPILVILTALLLIVSVIKVFDRRIQKIETSQQSQ